MSTRSAKAAPASRFFRCHPCSSSRGNLRARGVNPPGRCRTAAWPKKGLASEGAHADANRATFQCLGHAPDTLQGRNRNRRRGRRSCRWRHSQPDPHRGSNDRRQRPRKSPLVNWRMMPFDRAQLRSSLVSGPAQGVDAGLFVWRKLRPKCRSYALRLQISMDLCGWRGPTRLQQSNLPLVGVALAAGHANRSHFSCAFQTCIGPED